MLLLYTGMRCGEMIALRWRDVDWENGLLTVEKSASMAKNRIKLTNLEHRMKVIANSHFLRTAGPHFPDNPGHIKRTALETSRTERRLRPANQY